jgi:alcohol dehydrogenase class IV
LCLVAARIAFEHLPRVIADPGNLESREKMANAAAIAGLGYINSMVGLAHSMGHALGAAFKLPHGRAVGLCLPYALQFYAGDENGTRSLDILHFLGDAAEGEAQACRLLADRVRALAIDIEQPVSLADAGVTREAFDAALEDLIETALGDTVIFTSPRQPSEDELRRLFECAYEGSDVEF